MNTIITGTGIGIPKNVVRNDVLSKIMDTSDEWIRTRSGVEQRYYADPGQGSVELGMIAAQNALEAANRTTSDIDAVIFATMTPNFYFPGNGPVLQAKMGFAEIPTFDIRQQCSGFVYGLDLADSLIRSGKYNRILLIGADVHTPLMPWKKGWDITLGRREEAITPEEYAFNTSIRDRTVLFGDGAGAVVVERSENGARGFLGFRLFTDGSNITALYMKGGTSQRPWVDRKSTRLNSSHGYISYAVFCLQKTTPPAQQSGLRSLDHYRDLGCWANSPSASCDAVA